MIKKILLVFIVSLLFNSLSYGAGTGAGERDEKIEKGSPEKGAYKLIKKAKKQEKKGKLKKAEKKYKRALDLLLEANKLTPGNPDILNYLGFTSRKTGDFEGAEAYYLMGLALNPNHNGINEYLGELYLQTNRKNLALERLNVLKVCNCDEYQELKDLIDGTKTSKY